MKTRKYLIKMMMTAVLLIAVAAVCYLAVSPVSASESPAGFVKEDGETFFYKNGHKVTGWLSYEGSRFYFYRSSSTASGEKHTKGAMATGWQLIDGEKFYFFRSRKTESGEEHAKGAMATGWQMIDGVKYYFYRSSSTGSGLSHTKGTLATGWQKIDGYKYYFYRSSDGSHLKGEMAKGWQTIEGSRYYFFKSAKTYGRSGIMATGARNIDDRGCVFAADGKLLKTDMYGWYKVNGDYYFCDRKSGKMVKDKTVNCIKIGKDGKAVKDKYSEEKIPVMIRAREIIGEICKKDDSIKEKQWKCYEYVAKPPYLFKHYPLKKYRDKYACFTAIYANNILNAYGDQDKIGGECVAESAALGYLYNELDFGTVYLCDDGGHAWIEIDGRTWDPLFVEAKGKQWYNRKGYAYRALNKTEI
ncbi:MAG: hypothetical protein J5715_05035 [Clostridiales bacterium]|nr:hypothetical protein [Clostridiales bacterium]